MISERRLGQSQPALPYMVVEGEESNPCAVTAC